MKLNEKHHAAIVLAFYRALRDEYGETGLLAFSMAQRLYGEQRGRRMALRALRDGHKLGYTEYFAYSEWECTPEFFDVTMDARPGCVDECVTRCPCSKCKRTGSRPDHSHPVASLIHGCISGLTTTVRRFNPVRIKRYILRSRCKRRTHSTDSENSQVNLRVGKSGGEKPKHHPELRNKEP